LEGKDSDREKKRKKREGKSQSIANKLEEGITM
jgi:hypothetical protein